MKEVNPPNGFRNKKSFGRGGLQLNSKLKKGAVSAWFLRMILIFAAIAAFLITYKGALDPQPVARKPMQDSELREVLAGMHPTHSGRPTPGSPESELAAIGKKLFFDTRLSANGQVACATCHQPDKSFTDGKTVASGIGLTNRNAPTIINSHLGKWFFWDGRADSLEAQAVGPLENAKEHGLDRATLAKLLRRFYGQELRPESKRQSAVPPGTPAALVPDQKLAAYMLGTTDPHPRLTAILKLASSAGIQPSQAVAQMIAPPASTRSNPDDDRIVAQAALAIAAWERLQVAAESPFDEFIGAAIDDPSRPLDEVARTTRFGSEALAGLRLFTGKGNCILCHRGSTLSDQEFHNIGLGDTERQQQLSVEAWVADVAGRAKGINEVLVSEWNCRSSVWRKIEAGTRLEARTNSQSCRELTYLDAGNFENVGAFKTPTLRNVAVTAPFFHDGRAATLDDVLEHYSRMDSPVALGHREESLQPLSLNSEEKRQLQAFLESLTSPIRDLSEPKAL